MDHGAVVNSQRRQRGRLSLRALRVAGAAGALLVALWLVPAAAFAAGATLVDPADGKHFDYLDVAPMVQFDPGTNEQPKWVLLASDPAMTKTVRYCRYFVWASSNNAFHWGCNRWAVGVDASGNDRLQPLEAGKVYYWQVVSKVKGTDDEVLSAVRSFAVDAKPDEPTVDEISGQVYGTAVDDGTQLNLGAAAFVNSAVKVNWIRSSRLAPYAFRIGVGHAGNIDVSRSYIKITSAAGTRYLRLTAVTSHRSRTLFRLTATERRLKTKRFTYQAFLKSKKNGALVRSQYRVMLIKHTKSRPPAWKPD